MRNITILEEKVERLKQLITKADQNQATIQTLVRELLHREEELVRHDK